MPCLVCGAAGDPAHVRGVGAGWGDFHWGPDHVWEGRIAPLCRLHHRMYDRYEFDRESVGMSRLEVYAAADEIGRRWMTAEGIDRSSGLHPYEQMAAWEGGEG
jgi:hypothetical protein